MKQWTYCPIDNWNYSTHPQDSHGHKVASVRLGYKICGRRESVANLIINILENPKFGIWNLWKYVVSNALFNPKVILITQLSQPITNSQESPTNYRQMIFERIPFESSKNQANGSIRAQISNLCDPSPHMPLWMAPNFHDVGPASENRFLKMPTITILLF